MENKKLNALYDVGDEVFVKNIEELIAEFGEKEDKNIPTPSIFIRPMRKFCGKKVTISSVQRKWDDGSVGVYTLEEDPDNWNFDECVLRQIIEEPEVDPSKFNLTFDSLF